MVKVVRVRFRVDFPNQCSVGVGKNVYAYLCRNSGAHVAEMRPAPRAHRYFAPSTATGISVE